MLYKNGISWIRTIRLTNRPAPKGNVYLCCTFTHNEITQTSITSIIRCKVKALLMKGMLCCFDQIDVLAPTLLIASFVLKIRPEGRSGLYVWFEILSWCKLYSGSEIYMYHEDTG